MLRERRREREIARCRETKREVMRNVYRVRDRARE